MFRVLQSLLFVIALLPLAACADDSKSSTPGASVKVFKEGKHFEVLPVAVRTVNSEKIEVAEYFSYACGHCYKFEPSVKAWLKDIPGDVSFVNIPVIFSEQMISLAKIYYAAQQLGKIDVLHDEFFTAIHVGKINLIDPKEAAKIFARHGVNEKDFYKTFNSFGVDSQIKQAAAKTSGAKISATPTLVVNGKYRVHAQKDIFDVVNFLIAKERNEK